MSADRFGAVTEVWGRKAQSPAQVTHEKAMESLPCSLEKLQSNVDTLTTDGVGLSTSDSIVNYKLAGSRKVIIKPVCDKLNESLTPADQPPSGALARNTGAYDPMDNPPQPPDSSVGRLADACSDAMRRIGQVTKKKACGFGEMQDASRNGIVPFQNQSPAPAAGGRRRRGRGRTGERQPPGGKSSAAG
ncbi:hypothetical protein THAOC_22919 [Thalassiosira oceanica]|uniref:Uncharacterized protein n=1 Tax=Thalassiosira oceanica TaxID=159749 RepID=K0SEN4_THAOC|nr:hypothetical protein THAOC_22919 [Thalassiosira oceanica]|eukprot:EJK57077.1 hypothetical protein THAOC_22919 [Thalassiosira oceanica]